MMARVRQAIYDCAFPLYGRGDLLDEKLFILEIGHLEPQCFIVKLAFNRQAGTETRRHSDLPPRA